MPTYRDEAVVLRTHKLGEADRIVTMLSRQHGKIRAVAKGVRRTGSRFGARLEPFMVVDLQLYKGRSLDIVQQAVTLGPVRRRHRRRLPALHRRDRDGRGGGSAHRARGGHPALPAARSAPCVRSPAAEHSAGLTLDSYLLRALSIAGWAPSFADCAVTGAPGPHSAFVVQLGGVVADAVAPPGAPRLDPVHDRAARLPARGGVGERGGRRRAHAGPGERHRRRLHPVPPRARAALAGARRPVDAHEPRSRKTHKDAEDFRPLDWTGKHPPAMPASAVPRARRDRHGRQRPLGEPARASPASRATARGRRRCSTSSPARSRSASSTSASTRSRPRTGRGRPTRCAS